MAPFIGHWGLRDLEIAAQSYDPKNAQRNLKTVQIGKSHATLYIHVSICVHTHIHTMCHVKVLLLYTVCTSCVALCVGLRRIHMVMSTSSSTVTLRKFPMGRRSYPSVCTVEEYPTCTSHWMKRTNIKTG